MNKRFQVKRNRFGLALVDTKQTMTIVNDDGSEFTQDFVIQYGDDEAFLQEVAEYCNLHNRNVAPAYKN